MNIQDALKRLHDDLKSCKGGGDIESVHANMDDALLNFVRNVAHAKQHRDLAQKCVKIYIKQERWYA